jgi:SNF2-related domain/SNF2 Helicase protein/Helicase conserved C-terminal domain
MPVSKSKAGKGSSPNQADSVNHQEVSDVRVLRLAEYFVDSGRVVPGVARQLDGRFRSWWWPLPSALERDSVRSLIVSNTFEGHQRAANELSEAVDTLIRSRLLGSPPESSHDVASKFSGLKTPPALLGLLPKKAGRRSVAQAWVRSLVSADPFLPPNLDEQTVAAFVDSIELWVRSGAALQTRARIVLRLREPEAGVVESALVEPLQMLNDELSPAHDGSPSKLSSSDIWHFDVLVQDTEEPSVVVDASVLWDVESPFAPAAIAELLAGLGKAVRIAPELRELLESARAASIEVSSDVALQFVRTHIEALTEAGIGVRLPGWWSRRERLRLRARVKTKKSSSAGSDSPTKGGFGFDEIVNFEWEAALGGRKITKAELKSLTDAAANQQSLVRVRGEWVELDAHDLAAIAKLVGGKGQATASELLRSGLGLDGLSLPAGAVSLDGIDVVADGWLGELLDGALHSAVAPIEDPVDFHGALRPYQQRGAGWMLFLGRLGLGACLADDMGLGKTAQLIATLLVDPLPDPTLVVCPVSVLGNWQRELERFAPTLRVKVHHGNDRLRFQDINTGGAEDTRADYRADADVVLTTYSLVPRDLELLQSVRWARIVLDEAQQVKNPGTAQTKAIRQLQADRRVALTGTPVENRLSELWSLMHVLNPGLLGTAAEFKRRFAIPIERDHDQAATDLLRRVTSPFVLRRLKTDKSIIDDLPDKIEMTEHCPLTKEQASLYRAIVDDLLVQADEATGIGRRGLVLAGITKLKQVCNHPAHFGRDGSTLAGRSGKLNRVEELLDEIVEAGDKVLCFTQFAEWGELLVPYLSKRYGRDPLWLHGGVRRPLRDGMVEQFQDPDGPPIFLLSLKAGGTGLNLTAASHVIHLDRWWNPAVENQATDRAFRIGQKRTVLVHKLVSTGTIEERIDEMINSKRALAESVVGNGEQWITELDTAELRNVIALRGEDQ